MNIINYLNQFFNMTELEMKEIPTNSVTITIGDQKMDIEITNPFWLGNTMAFCYNEHQPTCVIGPHCTFMKQK